MNYIYNIKKYIRYLAKLSEYMNLFEQTISWTNIATPLLFFRYSADNILIQQHFCVEYDALLYCRSETRTSPMLLNQDFKMGEIDKLPRFLYRYYGCMH